MGAVPVLNEEASDLIETLKARVGSRAEALAFYRERYPDDPGFDDMTGFRSLPTFTKEAFLDTSRAASVMLAERMDEATYTATTSGTAGTATIIPRSPADEAAEARKFERMDAYVGEDESVLIIHNTDIERNVVRPLFADRDNFCGYVPYTDKPLALAVLNAVEPDCLWTSPTIAHSLGELADRTAGLNGVGRLILAGEPLSEQRQHQLEAFFPEAELYMDYGAQELGRLGYQCPALAGSNTYHVFPEEYLYEVLEPGKPTPAGREGELVVTSLVEGTGTPLTRYRTGDRVRIQRDICDCGRPAMTILGRIQFDRLKVGGITVYREHFEDALATVSDVVQAEYQIHLHEEEVDGDTVSRLEVHLLPRTEADRSEHIREEVEESIMENFTVTGDDSWADAVQKGWMRPLRVTLVDALEAGAKTKPVVDHRSDD